MFFGVNIGTVNRWRQIGCPGRPGRWDLSKIAQWRLTDEPAEGESPSLERKRAAEATLRELDVAERQHLLLSREKVRENLAGVAAIMKAAGEQLGRSFGPNAQDLLDQAWDDAVAVWRHMDSEL